MDKNIGQKEKDNNTVSLTETASGNTSTGFRDNLYSRINVSVSTMNYIITGLCIMLAAFLVYGIWLANIK